MEQLKEPRLNVLIVKPLVERLYDEDDVSVGMSLLSQQHIGVPHLISRSLLLAGQPHAVSS